MNRLLDRLAPTRMPLYLLWGEKVCAWVGGGSSGGMRMGAQVGQAAPLRRALPCGLLWLWLLPP